MTNVAAPTETAPVGQSLFADQPPRPPRLKGPLRPTAWGTVRTLLSLVWPLVAVLVAWACWVRLAGIPPAVAPDPVQVLTYLSGNLASLLGDAWHTMTVVIGGLVLGTVAGGVIAGLSWFSDVLRGLISGPALLTQCLPVATITPVLARIFGYSQTTMVLIAAIIAFFPVMVFTATGLRATPSGSDDLFVVLGAGRWQQFWRLAVPAALPRLLVALAVSVVAAVAGAMLAQWVMGTEGLGSRLVVAQSSFRTAEAWACSLVAIVISVFLYGVVSAVSRRVAERFA
jgi:ABC-type nitrate/sulfonate/bicarbonate transport system permease component